jgi:methionyl-tRNA formyltransferase
MDQQYPPFGICAVGFKGAEYLDGLIKGNCFPEIVFSYRQADDISCSIDKITKLCKDYRINFCATKHPAYSIAKPLCVVGWQYLFRQPTDNAVVFHDSLLPKYRGFAPTINALINGETRIGVTAFKPNERVDSGSIIGQLDASVTYPIRIDEALRRQAALMTRLTMDILPRYESAVADAVEQDHASASYSIWRDQQDYMINWTESAAYIRRMVDALAFPYSGAMTRLNDRILVIDRVAEVDDLYFPIRHPGKVWSTDGKLVVVCGRGMLRIDSVLTHDRKSYKFERLRTRLS